MHTIEVKGIKYYLINREFKTKKSSEPESPSAAIDSMLSNKSPTNSLATLKLRMSKSQDPSGYLINTCASAAGGVLAVRDQRLGTIGKWLCTRDTSTLSARPAKLKRSPQSPFQAELKLASILEQQLDILLL